MLSVTQDDGEVGTPQERSSHVPLYAAAKAGVLGLVRTHGETREKETGVKMLGIGPVPVDTPLLR